MWGGLKYPLEAYWACRVAVKLFRLAFIEQQREQEVDAVPIHLSIVIQRDGSAFLATVPQLPGLAIDGRTLFETIYRTIKAIQAYLRSLQKHGEKFPGYPMDLDPREPQPQTSVYGGTFWASPNLVGAN